MPTTPKDVMKVPFGENSCTRLLYLSATYTLPEASVSKPEGTLNCPFSEPSVPHDVMKVPFGENSCIRLLPESVTYTLPEEGPIATSKGDLKALAGSAPLAHVS
ncbi:MAG: hypothetical protein WB975_03275 [Nitrososphaeraceae archaeon]